MEEDNIYEYDDNNWPNKDLRTAAKGKERKGKVKALRVLLSPMSHLISYLFPSFLPRLIYLPPYIHTYIQLISYLDSFELQKQKKGPSPTPRNKKVRSMAASLLCSNRILVLHNNSLAPRVENPLYPRSFLSQAKRNPRRGKFCVVAVTESSKESSNKKTEEEKESKIPSWARPDSDEPPPWAQNETASQQQQQQGFEIPFYLYLLASAITAIAAVSTYY